MNENPRKRLDILDLKEWITMIRNNSSPKDIAVSFRTSLPSVYVWMNKLSNINYNYERVGELIRKKGPKTKDTFQRDRKVCEIIAEDSSLNQRGILSKLNESEISISQSTLSLALKDLSKSRKRLVLISDRKNDPININERHIFSVMYRRFENDDLLFLDETGFNLHTSRNCGYSPINSPARLTVKSSKGQT